MLSNPSPIPNSGGPFRLLKYFIISGFLAIAVVTALLGTILYTRSVDTLLKSAENYARLLAENLNYNIFIGFYSPLKARGAAMDLRKWDQFGALDSLVKDFTYGLKIQRIKIIDQQRKIVYSTEYDLIGKYEPDNSPIDEALNGKDVTLIREKKVSAFQWQGNWLADTYYPLREGTGNYWMLGAIYGVIEIGQDVTDQYVAVRRSIIVIIIVAVGLMAFLFIMLTLIVRRGERILTERSLQQKKLEQQLQQSEKLASIGQMVAVLAHEIRNPLGIIKSSAEVLAKKTNPDPRRIKKLCGVIVEEATRLSGILSDFLEFAKPRSPALKDIDMRDVVARVKTNLDQEIRTKHIRWQQEYGESEDLCIRGDPDLLYQALLNIAINSFEAVQDGGECTIFISADDKRLRIDFADNGHGIEQDDLPRIFTPFFTTHEMGTGLGLSVVHNIVSAHGGHIEVKSALGKGTLFSIILHRDGQALT